MSPTTNTDSPTPTTYRLDEPAGSLAKGLLFALPICLLMGATFLVLAFALA